MAEETDEQSRLGERRLVFATAADRASLTVAAAWWNAQPDSRVTCEELPWLAADDPHVETVLAARFERWETRRRAGVLGDAAEVYLPHVPEILRLRPTARIVFFRRPVDEVVVDTLALMQALYPIRTDHWSERLRAGWQRDPVRSRMYRKVPGRNTRESIALYARGQLQLAEQFAQEFPEQFRIVDVDRLDAEETQREVLGFLGYPAEQQVLRPELWTRRDVPLPKRPRPAAPRPDVDPLDPRRCAILVPVAGQILSECDRALRELEKRGYSVWRVAGYSAIDQGRNQLATDALLDGYEETFWIDSDVGFDPDAVDRIRWHRLPICCGIYPKKGPRELSSHVMPGTPKLVFGAGGGVVEILYAATGFLHVRREVYQAVLETLQLPICNERFAHPMIPFFHPMLHEIEDGRWYLAEDFAFSERVRRSGFKIHADTAIRLRHIGNYNYSWEDAGGNLPRYDTFTLNFPPPPPA